MKNTMKNYQVLINTVTQNNVFTQNSQKQTHLAWYR